MEPGAAPAPSYVLAPYFAASGIDDAWWQIDEMIWEYCRALPQQEEVSPVVAVTDASFLSAALAGVPDDLSNNVFYWLTGFDERQVSDAKLRESWNSIAAHSHRLNLINLYGGFFSVCATKVGLAGVSSGLGYSESRSWPELSSTGASPRRYYVRELHQFLSDGVAQRLVETAPFLRCDCIVCESDRPISALSYHELKQHFAQARGWERDLVNRLSQDDIANHLEAVATRFEVEVQPQLPRSPLVSIDHLRRWSSVVRGS
jgi:hypothetical protein